MELQGKGLVLLMQPAKGQPLVVQPAHGQPLIVLRLKGHVCVQEVYRY